LSAAPTIVPPGAAAAVPVDRRARLARLRLRDATRVSLDLHPSWLPADWPLRHRQLARLGAGGHEALSAWLRAAQGLPDPACRLAGPADLAERLCAIDGRDLRRIALECGVVAHRDQLLQGELAPELWRQARRLHPDLAEFALARWPASPALALSDRALKARPRAAGRVVLLRGYRLMLGCIAAAGAGAPLLRRVRLKFPRRASAEAVLPLVGARRAAYEELVHMCVVPERFGQWDWLF